MNKCKLCDSSWGDYWEEINRENLFFCCEICAIQYGNMINAIQETLNNDNFVIIEINGSSRLRTCVVSSNNRQYHFQISFGADGSLIHFNELSAKGNE